MPYSLQYQAILTVSWNDTETERHHTTASKGEGTTLLMFVADTATLHKREIAMILQKLKQDAESFFD